MERILLKHLFLYKNLDLSQLFNIISTYIKVLYNRILNSILLEIYRLSNKTGLKLSSSVQIHHYWLRAEDDNVKTVLVDLSFSNGRPFRSHRARLYVRI